MKLRDALRWQPATRDALNNQDLSRSLLAQQNVFNGDIDGRLAVFENSRIMPVDAYTFLRWPCDDAAGSAVFRETMQGQSLAPGVAVSSGWASPYGLTCVRVNEDATIGNRVATGGTGIVPTGNACSISLRVRIGRAGGAILFFGYWNSTVPLFVLRGDTPAAQICRPFSSTRVAGVQYDVNTLGQDWVAPGGWHELGVSYDGETIRNWVNGNLASENTTPSGPIEWGAGAAPRQWRLGTFGVTEGAPCYVSDIRVHSVARPQSWWRESYERGLGFYGRAA